MTNINCLEGIRCPACGNETDFRIAAFGLATVTDDGAEITGDLQWSDDSFIHCPQCKREGKVVDFRAYEEASNGSTQPEGVDIHAELAKLKQIAVIWSVEDVQAVRADLSDDQAWKVLQAVERRHDATIGITWDTLSATADSLFPELAGEAA